MARRESREEASPLDQFGHGNPKEKMKKRKWREIEKRKGRKRKRREKERNERREKREKEKGIGTNKERDNSVG